MSEPFDWGKLEEWVDGPCLHCEDEVSSSRGAEHVAMPVTRPAYVDDYLSELAGPNEQHGLGGHCVNPKCSGEFDESMVAPDGSVTCPSCGFEQNVNQSKDTPGGMTRSGLTLEQMGAIGEEVVLRMGELPGIGTIERANRGTSNLVGGNGAVDDPLDAIIQGQRGKFGCEIKTNHSQAQERFKIGGAEERQKKIVYCLTHGLKPALIGVRLNFFTDKAFIFFREGLHDSWIGNQKMAHVATVDFGDLNPFKSPDQQAQALAVENAHLPDQAAEEDEFASVFGAVKLADFNDKHPRDDDGKFTFKKDEHEIKTVDKSGKHTHTIRRCKHCGHLNHIPADHKGRVECSTCGEDIDRDLRAASVRLAGPDADAVAQQLGFSYMGRNANGHRQYLYQDESGTQHPVLVGSGAHGKRAAEIDAQRARQRMTRCINGQCMHRNTETLQQEAEPGAPVVRAGTTVTVNGQENYVMEVDGGIALVLNTQTGAEDVVPVSQLRAVAAESDPAYLYVYYMGELHVEPYEPSLSYEKMLDSLLSEFGQDLSHTGMDIDPTQVDAGEIRPRGFSISIEHKQLSDPQVREYAERALHDWWLSKSRDEWYTLQRDDHVLDPRL